MQIAVQILQNLVTHLDIKLPTVTSPGVIIWRRELVILYNLSQGVIHLFYMLDHHKNVYKKYTKIMRRRRYLKNNSDNLLCYTCFIHAVTSWLYNIKSWSWELWVVWISIAEYKRYNSRYVGSIISFILYSKFINRWNNIIIFLY